MLGYNKNWRDFRFDAQANVTFLKNKVLALGEGVEPIYGDLMSSKFTDRPTITKEGLPIGTFWGYKVTGINDQGNFIYEDIDNDGKPDKQVIGNPTPSVVSGTSSANDPGFSVFLVSQFLLTWSIAVNAISHLSVRMLYAGITPSFLSV